MEPVADNTQPEQNPTPAPEQNLPQWAVAPEPAPKAPPTEEEIAKKRFFSILGSLIGLAVIICGTLFVVDLIQKANKDRENREQFAKTQELFQPEKQAFENNFQSYANSIYSYDGTNSLTIYPTEEQIETARHECLKRFNISTYDFKIMGQDASEVEDPASAVERIREISSAFVEASAKIEECREDITRPILDQFNITYLDRELTKSNTLIGMTEMKQFAKISYIGREIKAVDIRFILRDKEKHENILYNKTFTVRLTGEQLNGKTKISLFSPESSVYAFSSSLENKVKNAEIFIHGFSGTYAE